MFNHIKNRKKEQRKQTTTNMKRESKFCHEFKFHGISLLAFLRFLPKNCDWDLLTLKT